MASPWNTRWTSKELFFLFNRAIASSDSRDKKLDFHVDDAAVTLNVCLGEEFTGGELYFGGVRCSRHVGRTKATEDEEIVFQHQVGTACLHLGKHRHQALPITSGRRLNLILWVEQQSDFFETRRSSFFLSFFSVEHLSSTNKTMISARAGVECIEFSQINN